MKSRIGLFLIILHSIFFLNFINSSHANNIGLSFGVDIDIIDDIFTGDENKLINLPLVKDSIFIGGDAFSTYYNGNDNINYNYGLKGKLGYSIINIDLYGFYGFQEVYLEDNNKEKNKDYYFSTTRAPIYGYGIAYGLGIMKMGLIT